MLQLIMKELKESSTPVSSKSIQEWLDKSQLFQFSQNHDDEQNKRQFKKIEDTTINIISSKINFYAYCKQFKSKIVDLYKLQNKTKNNLILGGLAGVGGMALSVYASRKLTKMSKKIQKKRTTQFLKTMKSIHT